MNKKYEFKPIKHCNKCGLISKDIPKDEANKAQVISLCSCNN